MSSRPSPILPLTKPLWSKIKPSSSQATSLSSRDAGGRQALGECSRAPQLRHTRKHPMVNEKANVAEARNYMYTESNARNGNGIGSSFFLESREQQSEHEEEDWQDKNENTLPLPSPGRKRVTFTVSSESCDEKEDEERTTEEGKEEFKNETGRTAEDVKSETESEGEDTLAKLNKSDSQRT